MNKTNLLKIFKSGVNSVDPEELVHKHLNLVNNQLSVKCNKKKKQFNLNNFDKILVIGAGKASAKMARAVEKILTNKIDAGIISVKKGYTENLKRIIQIEAGHPIPDTNSIKAAKKILNLIKKNDKKTLIIGLISGGGSSLLCLPEKITLKEKIRLTQKYLNAGADIKTLNMRRKKLSKIKGGKLAELMLPATSINFILSDVVGDDVSIIASGLTDFDHPQIINTIIGNNNLSLKGCERKAKELGFETHLIRKPMVGSAQQASSYFFRLAKRKMLQRHKQIKPLCIIAGGETTVIVKGSGKGGRCQEMVLSFLNLMNQSTQKFDNISFLSCGTDGTDGPTQYAGAYFDFIVQKKSKLFKNDIEKCLKNNDSNTILKKINALIKTRPTNTNVGDIQILLIK